MRYREKYFGCKILVFFLNLYLCCEYSKEWSPKTILFSTQQHRFRERNGKHYLIYSLILRTGRCNKGWNRGEVKVGTSPVTRDIADKGSISFCEPWIGDSGNNS